MAAKQASVIDSRDGRTNLTGMISRLTRILLALVTAFVFIGQMEAAAQHCAQLAQTAASETAASETAASETAASETAASEAAATDAATIVAAAENEAPPCHGSNAAVTDLHAAMSPEHGAPGHSGHGPNHTKTSPHCECIAALTGWVDLTGATTSTHAGAYVWLTPSETSFASAKPDPDLRPPRA